MKTEHQRLLLGIARDAIFQGLEKPGKIFPTIGKKQQAEPQALPTIGNYPELMEARATFVTLTMDGHLRGCIGMLEACRPLAEDVAKNAVAAAFRDPRFPPLRADEFETLEIHISVLSPPEEMTFSSEADLLSQIRPRIDGLILQEGGRRGTFLPSVWEELPEAEMFFEHLKLKAGLPAGYWSDTLRVFRYTAETIQKPKEKKMENEVPETNEEEQVQETQAPASAEATVDTPVVEAPAPGLTNEQRTFALCSYLIPLVTSTTFIVPLIIWLLKKGEDAYVEKHAKESLNFQISFVIYACVAWMSFFAVVGFLLLPAVVIAYMVFAIVASVKAYKGEDYKIPLCIRFIK